MKGTRQARLRRAIRKRRGEAVPPTRQTAARLRADLIARLFRERRIGLAHARAADEIRTVSEAVGRSLMSFLSPDLMSLDGGRHRAGIDFLDRMTERERRLWQRHYLPWTQRMLGASGELAGVRHLRLVIDAVVENRSLRDIESEYRLAHGRAFALVHAGLELYARGARLP